MRGVGEFILTVLYYTDGQYTPDDIEALLLLLEAYSDEKPDLKLINLPDLE